MRHSKVSKSPCQHGRNGQCTIGRSRTRGRIVDLQCSNLYVTDTFWADLERMSALYGGDGNAVQ